MKLTENQINLLDKIADKTIDKIVVTEASEYQNCFRTVLKKFGAKSPFQLDAQKKKIFFTEVKKECSKFKKNK